MTCVGSSSELVEALIHLAPRCLIPSPCLYPKLLRSDPPEKDHELELSPVDQSDIHIGFLICFPFLQLRF